MAKISFLDFMRTFFSIKVNMPEEPEIEAELVSIPRKMELMHVSSGRRVWVNPGVYEVAKIGNPYQHTERWLVLEGFSCGAAVSNWSDWVKSGQVTVIR